jgi:hypothetical protein
MRKLLDRNDPFFRRVWVRWLTVILPLLWGAVEFWHSQPFWGVLFIAAGVYAAWELLLRAAD